MNGTHITIEDVKEAVREAIAGHVQTPWLDTEQAARFIGCTYGTLKTWRAKGGGPRYHVDDLDAFVRGEVSR